MWFQGILLAALVAASAAMEEDVLLRAGAAASACEGGPGGGAPHPWDPQLLVLCADAGAPLTVVRCPPGTRASSSNATAGCAATEATTAPGQRRRRQGSTAASNVDRGCEAGAGIYCADCDRVTVCSVINNRLTLLNTESCSSHGDMSCDAQTHSCKAPNKCSSGGGGGGAFRCLAPGSYPDPEDCTRYHVCSDQLLDFSDRCVGPYNAVKGECAEEGTCDSSLPKKCSTEDSAQKAFGSDSPFYRVCLPQSPPKGGFTTSVLRCPEGQVFDDGKGACSYKCSGAAKRYPDPLDCRKYYDCPAARKEGAPDPKTCPTGLAYHLGKRMCVQEATVETCSAAATTTTTTIRPAAVTKAPAPPAPGNDCTREGPMADPARSDRYFVCDRSGDKFVKRIQTCPFMTSFSKKDKYCVSDWPLWG